MKKNAAYLENCARFSIFRRKIPGMCQQKNKKSGINKKGDMFPADFLSA